MPLYLPPIFTYSLSTFEPRLLYSTPIHLDKSVFSMADDILCLLQITSKDQDQVDHGKTLTSILCSFNISFWIVCFRIFLKLIIKKKNWSTFSFFHSGGCKLWHTTVKTSLYFLWTIQGQPLTVCVCLWVCITHLKKKPWSLPLLPYTHIQLSCPCSVNVNS